MGDKTVIFYFSQSGNSLYTAKKIAVLLGNAELISIAEAVHSGTYKYEGYEQVGFILPLYFMSMPRMAWHFMERVELKDAKYAFSIVTRAYTKGKIFSDMKLLLNKKSINLDYGRYVTYPDSYIRWSGPVKEMTRQKIYVQSDMKLDKITHAIKRGVKDIENEGVFLRVFAWGFYGVWKSLLSKNYKSFKVNNSCINCGICKKVCPAKNIRLEESMPIWADKCEDCMACVQHCPKQAIYFNKKTFSKERYRHPQITLNELFHN